MANNESRRRGLLATLPKLLIFLVVFAGTAFILFRLLGGGISSEKRNYTTIPKEYHLTYMPSDFRADIDTDNALAILSNPNRYQREFDQLVYDFNLSLLNHVANRMGLDSSTKGQITREYERRHDLYRNLYYNDFMMLKDTSAIGYKTWYGTELMDATDYFHEVASRHTCSLITDILVTVLETQGGAFAAKGSKVETPCGIAFSEGLRPMIKRLQEQAAIEDFSRAKGFVQERVERAIAELATMEVSDTKALSRKLQTKVWGYAVSSTDVEISATSKMKVGFDLNKQFRIDVNSNAKMIEITLPQPEILSLEVFPRVDKMNIGWMRELKGTDFNQDMEALTDAFRQDAMKSDVFGKARTQAAELMDTMLGPVVASLGNKYRLKVQFEESNREIPMSASSSGEIERASALSF